MVRHASLQLTGIGEHRLDGAPRESYPYGTHSWWPKPLRWIATRVATAVEFWVFSIVRGYTHKSSAAQPERPRTATVIENDTGGQVVAGSNPVSQTLSARLLSADAGQRSFTAV